MLIDLNFICFLLFIITSLVSSLSSKYASSTEILQHLQTEAHQLSCIQRNLDETLSQKGIHVCGIKIAEKNHLSHHQRVCVSTVEHPVDCRVSLSAIPFGSKGIAPCGCTGSQKWIQFSLANKLRRKDPEQWKICKVSFYRDVLLNSTHRIVHFLLVHRLVNNRLISLFARSKVPFLAIHCHFFLIDRNFCVVRYSR